ncbi:hypothetical protein Tco_1276261 [Tanacetum coccineum]
MSNAKLAKNLNPLLDKEKTEMKGVIKRLGTKANQCCIERDDDEEILYLTIERSRHTENLSCWVSCTLQHAYSDHIVVRDCTSWTCTFSLIGTCSPRVRNLIAVDAEGLSGWSTGPGSGNETRGRGG